MDTERLEKALIAADAAGDTVAARELAQALRAAMRPSLAKSDPREYDPSSPEFQERYGPTSGMGTADRLFSGAGKFLYDVGRGTKQLAVETGEKFGLVSPSMSDLVAGTTPSERLRRQQDEQRRQDAPLMDTTAGKVGNIGGGVAFAAPLALIPGVNTYAGSALVGSALGAVQPVGTDDSRAFNTGVGAASGVVGKYVGDRVAGFLARPRAQPQAGSQTASQAASGASATATPGTASSQTVVNAAPQVRATGGGYTFGHVGDDVSAGLSQTEREIMRRGQNLGMRATPGQATGSRALQQLEAKLESQPMTSGPFNTIKANNARVLNRAAAEAIGENADVVDSAVLDRAFTRIGNVFDDAADDVQRQIDPGRFIQTYQQIQDDTRGLFTGFGDHPLVQDLTTLATQGQATGRQLQTLTSKLSKAAYKQMTSQGGDRDLGMALYRVKDYVDDLLESGMDASRATGFQAARQQYRNLMMLTSRVGVVNPSTGNVSGRSLANVLQNKDKSGFLRGRNQSGMYDAARFAQAFQPIVGDSGTATRMPLQGLTDMVARIPLNIATRAYTSSPAVNLAVGSQAAANAAANAVSPVARAAFGPLGPYLPRYSPPMAGLLGSELASQ